MIRVLHIAAGNLYGGVETLLVTLARCRDLCPSMEPEFAVCFEGRLSSELTETGVPVHRLGAVRIRHPLSVWQARRRLAELLRQRNFDAVVCHMAWPQAVFGPVVRAAGVALIVWRHDAGDGRHWLERWARLTWPDLTICNSRFTESALRSFAPDLCTELMYYPVAAAQSVFTEADRMNARRELGAPAESTVIIQVSRMEAWKGHRLHLRALSKLRDRDDWVCWMVGGVQRPEEVRYLEQLRAMALNLRIDARVIFTGQRSDVSRLLAAADIFCQPNTGAEPFGIVFIEALYAGLPVVTTAIGGGAEIVNDSCGVLVRGDDEDALASALRNLIENPESRSRMSWGGPSRAHSLCDPARQLTRLATSISALSNSHACDPRAASTELAQSTEQSR